MAEDNALIQFDSLFDELVHCICTSINVSSTDELCIVMKHLKSVCLYNVPHGKKTRGLTVVNAYQSFCNNVTDENLKIARIVGWCIEFLQASFLVHDDIMDQSETRRGQPCWYKTVGLNAVNDGIFLEQAIFILLKHYVKHKDYYCDIIDLFHENILRTCVGQCLDVLTSTRAVNFDDMTRERYQTIVVWKTAYYSFYLPVAAAMIMSGITDPDSHLAAKTILLKMGEYFQIQDDFLDCFGDPSITGKIGTDIEEAKCSWLLVQALLRCPEGSTDRQLLMDGLGRAASAQSAQKVRELYRRLDLPKVFEELEENNFASVKNDISHYCDGRSQLKAAPFLHLAKKIYKRSC